MSLIFAESSLELVPKQLQHHPSVVAHAKKLGKNTSEILLDNSWHYGAMKGIDNEIKRGRPDIVHICVLEACTIPLYQQSKVKLYIHTINDNVIYFDKHVHIPKSYHRFAGLMEKLFLEKRIAFENNILLELKTKSFNDLIAEINPSSVIGFSTQGTPKSFQEVAAELDDNSCLVIGGFQKGHFSKSIQDKITKMYSVNSSPLEAHVVTSRMLYEYEKTIFM